LAYFVLLGLAALDAAGYSIIAPVVPQIGDQTGAGPGVMGALVACFAIGQALGYPLAGRGIQRRHAVAVLLGSLVLIVIGDLGFIAGGGLPVYFPARLLQGIGAGGLWMGVSFAVLERYPGQEFQRLTGILGMYSVGAIAGPAMAAVGGIRGPFLIHLGAVFVLVSALSLMGPGRAVAVGSDRAALRTPGFWLASAGILLVALGLGTFDGPLPLHFAEELSQAQISALYVGAAIVAGASATLSGRIAPRLILGLATLLIPLGIALAGLTETVSVWVVAAALAGVGVGVGEAGALGVLLETIGTERIVLAMVVWSQLWAIGYLAGPAAGGAVAEALGFGAIGLVPLAAALLVVASFRPFASGRGRTRSGAWRA
jgi:MFS family permease